MERGMEVAVIGPQGRAGGLTWSLGGPRVVAPRKHHARPDAHDPLSRIRDAFDRPLMMRHPIALSASKSRCGFAAIIRTVHDGPKLIPRVPDPLIAMPPIRASDPTPRHAGHTDLHDFFSAALQEPVRGCLPNPRSSSRAVPRSPRVSGPQTGPSSFANETPTAFHLYHPPGSQ